MPHLAIAASCNSSPTNANMYPTIALHYQCFLHTGTKQPGKKEHLVRLLFQTLLFAYHFHLNYVAAQVRSPRSDRQTKCKLIQALQELS